MSDIEYHNKYLKYKHKYINLKIGGSTATDKKQDNKFVFSEVDLYLFFDLIDVSYQIIYNTSPEDIYILIGDTPSYLKPFLETFNRKVYNLPSSCSPYACFFPPHASPIRDEILYKRSVPKKEDEAFFFNYLNTKTMLTKDVIKKNWNNIILIDTSSGGSIHGVSVFFNRYIGNINLSNKCINITGAKPLKFIRLSQGDNSSLNISPILSKNITKAWLYRNYNPKLIIVLPAVPFYYGTAFYIEEAYPRYVPMHSVNLWYRDPYTLKKSWKTYEEFKIRLEKALNNLSLLKKLFKLYITFRKYTVLPKHPKTETKKEVIKKNVVTKEIYNIIIKMPLSDNKDKMMLEKISINDPNLVLKLHKLFEQIIGRVMILKYDTFNWFENIILNLQK
jgi:hypothetical protein